MYRLKDLQPIKLDDLVRVGRNFDGGYVISMQSINNTKLLLSFGISNDWSFEKDFIAKKEVTLYAYDYSIKSQYFVSECAKREFVGFCIAGIIGNLIILKRLWVLEYYRRLKRATLLYHDFHSFFNITNGHFYRPKFIGMHNDEKTISFDNIFEELGEVDENSCFIKMDIEGAELNVLPDLKKHYAKINGMVVEFHELNTIGIDEEFENLITELKKYFYIGHIHANCYGGVNKKTNNPNTLELTFVNKTLVEDNPEMSKFEYPITGLDFANNGVEEEDYVINFRK